MTSDRLKSLVKLRLVLSVIALLLAGTMVFSGVMHLVTGGKAPVEEPDQPASQETVATEPEEQATVATEAATEEQVEETESQEKLGTQEAGPKDAQSGQSGESGSPGNQGNTSVTEPSVENIGPDKTKPFATEPPATEPPATDPPATEPPATEPPATEPLATEPLATEPLATNPIKDGHEGKDKDKGKGLSAEQQTVQKSLSDSGETRSKSFPWGMLFWVSAGLLIVVLIVILAPGDRIKSIVALLLAGIMVVCSVMHLVTGRATPVEEPDQPASQETAATEPDAQVTEATEAATEEQVEDTDSQKKLGTQEAGTRNTKPGQSGESDSPGNQGNTPVTEPSADTIVPENTKPSYGEEKPPLENSSAENPPPKNPIPDIPPAYIPPVDIPPATNPPEEIRPVPVIPIEPPKDGHEDTHTNTGKGLSAEQQTLQKSFSDSGETRSKSFPWGILFWGSAGLLAADLMAILILSDRIKKEKEALRKAGAKAHAAPAPGVSAAPIPRTHRIRTVAARPAAPAVPTVGTIHQIGARDYQQDSLGHTQVLGEKGVLAVVADGMGGLSGGEKVSQRIVVNAMNMGSQLKAGQTNGVLWKMVNQINEDVNRLLGPEGLYKSGSTLVAVLTCGGQFQWIAVGDSRIYLYRQGYANQLNQDHDQLQAWMADVLEGRRSLEEVLRHPDGRKLTSFIGMGQLKHIDGSLSPIALEAGDRLVLMTDGVYSVVNEERLAAVLKRFPDVNQAASAMDRMIREAKNPHQDNYTAIILGF